VRISGTRSLLEMTFLKRRSKARALGSQPAEVAADLPCISGGSNFVPNKNPPVQYSLARRA